MTVRSAYDDNMKPYIYEGNMKHYGWPQGSWRYRGAAKRFNAEDSAVMEDLVPQGAGKSSV
jgi:hypothetical protein